MYEFVNCLIDEFCISLNGKDLFLHLHDSDCHSFSCFLPLQKALYPIVMCLVSKILNYHKCEDYFLSILDLKFI